MKSLFWYKSVLLSDCHFRNILYSAFQHTHTHRKTDDMQLHSIMISSQSECLLTLWGEWSCGDSVALLSLHSWARAAEFMLISWLRHCFPWRGMCHLPCHLSEQERLVVLPQGLPSRSSTADAGEGYRNMEPDGTYGGQLRSAPGWRDRSATTLRLAHRINIIPQPLIILYR